MGQLRHRAGVQPGLAAQERRAGRRLARAVLRGAAARERQRQCRCTAGARGRVPAVGPLLGPRFVVGAEDGERREARRRCERRSRRPCWPLTRARSPQRSRPGTFFESPTACPSPASCWWANGGGVDGYTDRDDRHTIATGEGMPACPSGSRVPAESQSALSARSLLGMRIINVSRPHAPSIIAPWQGSGWRSDTKLPLRHDEDRGTT